jgi:hypothetical protein
MMTSSLPSPCASSSQSSSIAWGLTPPERLAL